MWRLEVNKANFVEGQVNFVKNTERTGRQTKLAFSVIQLEEW